MTRISTLIIALLFVLNTGSAIAAQPKQSSKSKVISKPAKKKTTKKKIIYSKKSTPSTYSNAQMSPPIRDTLEPVSVSLKGPQVVFTEMPHFSAVYHGKVTGVSQTHDYIFYSINAELQKRATEIVKNTSAPHVAIVAIEPSTGRILAMAGKSISIGNILTHSGFPAASLFKVVTASAALEKGGISPTTEVNYRGGAHMLDRSNVFPDPLRDRLTSTVTDAIGKSNNPVFARIALQHLSSGTLQQYANLFGFNGPLGFDINLPVSSAYIPVDEYGLGRTAAGFGAVHLSPIHAAVMMAGIANKGVLPRPTLVDEIVKKDGSLVFKNKPSNVKRMLKAETSEEVFEMMESTTITGTSRKAFTNRGVPLLPFRVSGKTGTLRGDNPKGLNNWFIGAAPVENPKIAIAVIVVNPGTASAKASSIAKTVLESYFKK